MLSISIVGKLLAGRRINRVTLESLNAEYTYNIYHLEAGMSMSVLCALCYIVNNMSKRYCQTC